MAALWFRLRTEMRSRWRAALGLALIAGVGGGVVLASVAGARRTGSAFDRLIDRHRVADVLINPDNGTDSALEMNDVRDLPQVADVSEVQAVFALVLRPDGYADPDLSPLTLALVDGRAVYEFHRPRLVEGRLPNPRRENEIFANTVFARQHGLRAGDHFTLRFPADFERFAFTPAQGPPPETIPFDFVVTGIGLDPYDAVVDQEFEVPSVIATPAFWSAHPEMSAGFWGMVARLKDGSRDLAGFRSDVEALVPNESIAFQTLPVTRDKVQRAIRPDATALLFFALAVGATVLLIVGQALARQLFVESAEHPALASIGYSRSQLFALGMMRAGLIAAGGTVVAVGFALAASPLFPIGRARVVDPTPGFAADLVALGAGGIALFAAVLLLAVVPAWRRARVMRDHVEGALRASVIAAALSRSGGSIPATVGVRQALEPGRGRTAVPVRTTIGAAAIGIASIIAALTFGSSLNHLASTPRLYGWNWDVLLPTPEEEPDVFDGVLTGDANVAGFSRAAISSITVGTRTIVAVGVEAVRGSVGPRIVEGHAPGRDDELALGSKTMRDLDAAVGETITATTGGGRRSLRIVGRVVLPTLGNYPGADKTSLGEGAVLTRRALSELGPQFSEIRLVSFRRGVDPAAAVRSIKRQLDKASEAADGEAADVNRAQLPSDVNNYQRLRATPVALAGVLGVLALAAVAHVLGAASRRRARDLAVLKTLGMVNRQIRATVAWQASTVAVAALLIGLPIGIIGGRWIWSAFVDQLGTVAPPRTSIVLVALAVPAVLASCNLVSAFPARAAARTGAALVLRTE